MTERQLAVDFVPVPASLPRLGEVTRLLEVFDDLRRRSFGNPDADCDVTDPHARIGVDALEHMGMVGHETPEMLLPREVPFSSV